MVASTEFASFLRDQLARLGYVTMRRMFGKTGVFCEGVMFGIVSENILYFRVDGQNRAMFKEAESFPSLNYEKKVLGALGEVDRSTGGDGPCLGEPVQRVAVRLHARRERRAAVVRGHDVAVARVERHVHVLPVG